MTVRFDAAAAQDALARSDDGVKAKPGDRELIDAYEGLLQAEQLRRDDAERAADRADWLSRQCPGCHEGGTGEECDEHWDARVYAFALFALGTD